MVNSNEYTSLLEMQLGNTIFRWVLKTKTTRGSIIKWWRSRSRYELCIIWHQKWMKLVRIQQKQCLTWFPINRAVHPQTRGDLQIGARSWIMDGRTPRPEPPRSVTSYGLGKSGKTEHSRCFFLSQVPSRSWTWEESQRTFVLRLTRTKDLFGRVPIYVSEQSFMLLFLTYWKIIVKQRKWGLHKRFHFLWNSVINEAFYKQKLLEMNCQERFDKRKTNKNLMGVYFYTSQKKIFYVWWWHPGLWKQIL